MIDWSSRENALLLNPRLPAESQARFEGGWRTFVEGQFEGQIGIATSGSSGDPLGKLIVISKRAILASAAAVNRHFKSNANDIWLKTLPSFHVGGLGIYARAHLSGASVVESKLEKWDARGLHAELVLSRATLLSLVPTQLFDLLAAGLRAPASLRAVVIGGGRLEQRLRERAGQLGWPIYASYGCTECSSQVATSTKAGGDDLPVLDHVEVRVEASGRLSLKSAALLTGVISFGEHDASFNDPKHDGWFTTEDHATIQSRQLEILGRDADFVKIGGEGVMMSRLEDRLERLRGDFAADLGVGVDLAILAAADERLGATIVLLTNAPEKSSVEDFVLRFNEGVLPFERVRQIYCVDSIPRSPLGKLIRGSALALVGLKSVTHV